MLANDGVSLRLKPGETLGLVGESGSGNSVFCRAVLGLAKGEVTARRLAFEGRDLREMPAAERRGLRGRGIAMVFQSPMNSLDPVWTIGDQLVETVRLHGTFDRAAARREAVALLDRVGIRALRDPYSAKPYALFYTTKRVGGGMQDFRAIKLLRFAA